MIIRTLFILLLAMQALDLHARDNHGGKKEGGYPQSGSSTQFPPSYGQQKPDDGMPGYGTPGSMPPYSPAIPVASPYGGMERIYKGLPQNTQKSPISNIKMPRGYVPGPGNTSGSGKGYTSGSANSPAGSGSEHRIGETRTAYEARTGKKSGGTPSPGQILRDPGSQSIKRIESAPAVDKAMSRLEPGYEQPAAKPSQIQVEFRSAETRMQQALEKGDYQKVGTEAQAIKSRASSLRGRLRDLPLEERLEVGSIMQMYEQGAALIHEGQRSEEDAKIRMGMQRIGEATTSLERLDKR